MKLAHASTFSGIGGPEVAASMLGWENLFHCEINPFGRKVLEYWYPNARSYVDITKTDFSEWRGKVDVLSGGFPCQPFSYAGQRRGSEDDRYLWPYMLKVIDQVRPTWFVGENVAGITTMVLPSDFVEVESGGTLFEESHLQRCEQKFVIEEICRELEGVGYSVQPIVIPACSVSAPHRRDRVFFIARRNDVADTDRKSDVSGKSGEYEGESGTQRIQEWNEVQDLGESSPLRFQVPESSSDTLCRRSREGQTEVRSEFPVGKRTLCDGSKRNASDSVCEGLQESITDGGSEERAEVGARTDDRTERFDSGNSISRNASDSGCIRLRKAIDKGAAQAEAIIDKPDDKPDDVVRGLYGERLQFGNRWATFPSVSAVYRGNDGIPFDVDGLAIPFSRWRIESLKGYGNAIVPQVIYEIYRAIDIIENQ